MNKDFQELKLKTSAELRKIEKDNREKLHALRFDLVAGKVKNVDELRRVKKNIAKILTILNSPYVADEVKK